MTDPASIALSVLSAIDFSGDRVANALPPRDSKDDPTDRDLLRAGHASFRGTSPESLSADSVVFDLQAGCSLSKACMSLSRETRCTKISTSGYTEMKGSFAVVDSLGGTGVAANHHFLVPNDGSPFRFTAGHYRMDVFAKLLGDHRPIPALLARHWKSQGKLEPCSNSHILVCISTGGLTQLDTCPTLTSGSQMILLSFCGVRDMRDCALAHGSLLNLGLPIILYRSQTDPARGRLQTERSELLLSGQHFPRRASDGSIAVARESLEAAPGLSQVRKNLASAVRIVNPFAFAYSQTAASRLSASATSVT